VAFILPAATTARAEVLQLQCDIDFMWQPGNEDDGNSGRTTEISRIDLSSDTVVPAKGPRYDLSSKTGRRSSLEKAIFIIHNRVMYSIERDILKILMGKDLNLKDSCVQRGNGTCKPLTGRA